TLLARAVVLLLLGQAWRSRAGWGLRPATSVGLLGRDRAEEAVGLVVRAGGEEQGVGRAVVRRPFPELERPEAVDRQHLPIGRSELADEHEGAVRLRLEGVDLLVAEVADEE